MIPFSSSKSEEHDDSSNGSDSGGTIIFTVVILGLSSILSYCYYLKASSSTSVKTTTTGREGSTSIPFTQFGHPLKYKIDKILSVLFPLLMPFESLCCVSYVVPGQQQQQLQQETPLTPLIKVRKRIEIVESILHAISCHLWNRQCRKKKIKSNHSRNIMNSNGGKNEDYDDDDYLVGGTVHVPRQWNILKEWNIVPNDAACTVKAEDDVRKNNFVEIEITCPASCIRNKDELMSSSSLQMSSYSKQQLLHGYQNIFPSSSFVPLTNIQFENNCPIIIYFHGGGMVCGTSRDGTFISDFVSGLSNHESSSSSSSHRTGGIIVLSVTYRLAPENPFPSSIIDCLSAASFIIEHFTSTSLQNNNNNSNHNDIHIAGFSAGGSLATVVGLECYRRYPGTIKSIVPIDAMLLPHTDTQSCHLNSLSSSFCPATFLRWCWAAYLQLGVQGEAKDGNDNDDEGEDKGSGCSTKSLISPIISYDNVEEYKNILEKSPWFQQPYGITRLFYPRINLPNNLNTERAPVIIVKTSTADVLRDDGLDLVKVLKAAGANVQHFEMVGSHGISSWLGMIQMEMIDAWSKIIWDSDE